MATKILQTGHINIRPVHNKLVEYASVISCSSSKTTSHTPDEKETHDIRWPLRKVTPDNAQNHGITTKCK